MIVREPSFESLLLFLHSAGCSAMCVLVKNLCSPPNNDIEYWSWSCAASAPAHTYFFITTLPSNTFGWNKHSQGYSLQNMETFSSKVYVHIVSFGSGWPRLPNVDSILFVSHYSTPANTSLVLPKPPIFGPSVGYCFFAFYFYYITTPSEQHLEFRLYIRSPMISNHLCLGFALQCL